MTLPPPPMRPRHGLLTWPSCLRPCNVFPRISRLWPRYIWRKCPHNRSPSPWELPKRTSPYDCIVPKLPSGADAEILHDRFASIGSHRGTLANCAKTRNTAIAPRFAAPGSDAPAIPTRTGYACGRGLTATAPGRDHGPRGDTRLAERKLDSLPRCRPDLALWHPTATFR